MTSRASEMPGEVSLRRELGLDEHLVRCTHCGRVEIPLNEAEQWRYAVTGDGLGSACPDKRRVPRCDWKPLEPHPPRTTRQDLTPEPATPSSGAIGSSGEAQAP
jgi:hypothetical protein